MRRMERTARGKFMEEFNKKFKSESLKARMLNVPELMKKKLLETLLRDAEEDFKRGEITEKEHGQLKKSFPEILDKVIMVGLPKNFN